ncbi:unannotated protein [freshwater metagenome]|uniref:Unannotated protein n=1 Tax=freshwater metagenome TaxID=449393 RepID=A0A6J7EAR9_9ZZZZ
MSCAAVSEATVETFSATGDSPFAGSSAALSDAALLSDGASSLGAALRLRRRRAGASDGASADSAAGSAAAGCRNTGVAKVVAVGWAASGSAVGALVNSVASAAGTSTEGAVSAGTSTDAGPGCWSVDASGAGDSAAEASGAGAVGPFTESRTDSATSRLRLDCALRASMPSSPRVTSNCLLVTPRIFASACTRSLVGNSMVSGCTETASDFADDTASVSSGFPAFVLCTSSGGL